MQADLDIGIQKLCVQKSDYKSEVLNKNGKRLRNKNYLYHSVSVKFQMLGLLFLFHGKG